MPKNNNLSRRISKPKKSADISWPDDYFSSLKGLFKDRKSIKKYLDTEDASWVK